MNLGKITAMAATALAATIACALPASAAANCHHPRLHDNTLQSIDCGKATEDDFQTHGVEKCFTGKGTYTFDSATGGFTALCTGAIASVVTYNDGASKDLKEGTCVPWEEGDKLTKIVRG